MRSGLKLRQTLEFLANLPLYVLAHASRFRNTMNYSAPEALRESRVTLFLRRSCFAGIDRNTGRTICSRFDLQADSVSVDGRPKINPVWRALDVGWCIEEPNAGNDKSWPHSIQPPRSFL